MVIFGSICVIVGCSGKGELNLVPSDGTVTYMDKPLAGATVMFSPEKGPLATGMTDANGKFTLKTGTRSGIVAGKAKATITLVDNSATSEMAGVEAQPKSKAEMDAYMQAATEIRKKMADGTIKAEKKSLIPEKYGNINTTDLTYTIKQGEANHISIELK